MRRPRLVLGFLARDGEDSVKMGVDFSRPGLSEKNDHFFERNPSMGRAPRVVRDGATYHVVARGNNRAEIFLDDVDRERFMERLTDVAQTRQWRGIAYCLMGNHFHLAFTTPHADLPDGMRDLMGFYARGFNARHRKTGHPFGGRYRAGAIETDSHLLSTIRYIARNPVAARLVAHPEEWPWSSYPALLADKPEHPFIDAAGVLDLFARNRWRARAALRHFVEDAKDDEPPPTPRPQAPGHKGPRPSARTLLAVLAADDAIAACLDLGYTHRQIAEASGVTRSAISHRLRIMRRAHPQVPGPQGEGTLKAPRKAPRAERPSQCLESSSRWEPRSPPATSSPSSRP